MRKFIIALCLVLMFCGSAAAASEPLEVTGMLSATPITETIWSYPTGVEQDRRTTLCTYINCGVGTVSYAVDVPTYNTATQLYYPIPKTTYAFQNYSDVTKIADISKPAVVRWSKSGVEIGYDTYSSYDMGMCSKCGRGASGTFTDAYVNRWDVIYSGTHNQYTWETRDIVFRNAQTSNISLRSSGGAEVVIDGGTYSGSPAA